MSSGTPAGAAARDVSLIRQTGHNCPLKPLASGPPAMPSPRLWIKNPLALFTANEQRAPGGLVVENGMIVELLGAGQAPEQPVSDTFDAREHVVLPGLVNAHHHFHQTLTRAWGPAASASMRDWLSRLYPVWAGMNAEHLALASRVALAE